MLIELLVIVGAEVTRYIQEAPARRTLESMAFVHHGNGFERHWKGRRVSAKPKGRSLVILRTIAGLNHETRVRRAGSVEAQRRTFSGDDFGEGHVLMNPPPEQFGVWDARIRSSFVSLTKRGNVSLSNGQLVVSTQRRTRSELEGCLDEMARLTDAIETRVRDGVGALVELLATEGDESVWSAGLSAYTQCRCSETDDLLLRRATTELPPRQLLRIAMELRDRDAIETALSRGGIDDAERTRADELVRQLSGRRRY